jgi:type I restriction enzyme M protein
VHTPAWRSLPRQCRGRYPPQSCSARRHQRNDYNLNLPRYIDSTEAEDLQDIAAHLRGGIPDRDLDALKPYWQVFPAVRAALFQKADRPGYSQLRVAASEIKPAIFSHEEFTAFNETATKLFAKWKKANTPRLKGFAQGGHPKALVETLGESLLVAFSSDRSDRSVAPALVDPYDLFQHLMDYWTETMQDDCYLIVADGWREAAQPRLIVEDKARKTKAKPDFTLGKKKYTAELIPPALVIARYYAQEQAAIDTLETQLAALAQQMEEMAEEQGGEEGLLEDAKNDKGKLTKASVSARLREIGSDRSVRSDPSDRSEEEALQAYLALTKQEADTGAKLKTAQDALIAQVAARYAQLTEDEIKTLVVDDKWLAILAAAVQDELDRVSQTLTGRIRQLAERYATPLHKLVDEVDVLAKRVEGHLRKMGFKP